MCVHAGRFGRVCDTPLAFWVSFLAGEESSLRFVHCFARPSELPARARVTFEIDLCVHVQLVIKLPEYPSKVPGKVSMADHASEVKEDAGSHDG